MPRGHKGDLLGSIRAQVGNVLYELDRRIDGLRAELSELTAHADSWRRALGASPGRRGPGRPPGARSRRSVEKRVSWDEVLASVPQRFGVEDVMKHPGAAARGRAQVYPAFTRWEQAKAIRRVEKGVYEKTEKAPSAMANTTRGRRTAASKRPSKRK